MTASGSHEGLPERRPRVTVVADAAPALGGISTFAGWLASDAVLGKRFDITLLNTTRIAEWKGGSFSVRNVVRALVDAVRAFKAARQSDVVHVQTALMPTGPLLRAAAICRMARLGGATVVCHVHTGLVNRGPHERFTPSRLQRWLLNRLGAHRLVAVSQAGKRGLSECVPAAMVSVIDNAIEPGDFGSRREPEDERVILYAGAVGEAKGLLDLLSAIRRIGFDDPWRLEIVGGANQQGREEAESVFAAYRDAGLEDCLVGPVAPSELRERMERASIFVLPSHFEGQPLALLEAMALGLPVVATQVGGIPDIVRDGTDGLLVAPRDPGSLASALTRLMGSDELRAQMGVAAKERVEETFSIDRLRERLTDLYIEATNDVGA